MNDLNDLELVSFLDNMFTKRRLGSRVFEVPFILIMSNVEYSSSAQ